MRNVLRDNAEVAHYWANKVQQRGQNANGSLYFVSDKIYSYGSHFCIARLLPDRQVAFTTRRYSITASRHKALCRQAVSNRTFVYCSDPEASAASERREALTEINNKLSSAAKPRIRQSTRDRYLAEALEAARQFNAYLAALLESERVDVDPIDITEVPTTIEAAIALAVERERVAAIAEREYRKKYREAYDAWCEGTSDTIDQQGVFPIALRIVGDEVQTSRGARVKVASAVKLWRVIQVVQERRAKGKYAPASMYERMDVGPYTLETINTDGSVVIGCHVIAYDTLRECAVKLGEKV
jgi:hypothetical protein